MIVQYSIIIFFLFLIFTIGSKKAYFLFFATTLIGIKFQMAGPLNVEDILILIFLLASLKDINNTFKNGVQYPFFLCSILSVVSIIHSAFFTTVSSHIPSAITECLESFLVPFLLFVHIRNKNDIIYLVRWVVYVSLFIFVIAIWEIIVGKSIWLDWIRTFSGKEFGWEMQTIRFGSKRIQSVFMQSVTYGYYSVSMMFLLLFSFIRWKNFLQIKDKMIFVLFVSFLGGGVLSGSRSSIFPLAIVLVLFFINGNLKKSYLFYILGILLILCLGFSSQLNEILLSVTQSNKVQLGSSTDMRYEQFELAYAAFRLSPLTGLGYNATFESVNVLSGILGAESVWLGLMIDEGIIGILAYISIYVAIFNYMKKQLFITYSYIFIQLMVNTLTSTPGLDVGFAICLAIIIQNIYIYFGKQKESTYMLFNKAH